MATRVVPRATLAPIADLVTGATIDIPTRARLMEPQLRLVLTADFHGERVYELLPHPKAVIRSNQYFGCSALIDAGGWAFRISQGDTVVDIADVKDILVRRALPPRAPDGCPDHARDFIQREAQEIFAAVVGLRALRPGGRVFSQGRPYQVSANKIVQLVLAREVGLAVPNTCVTNVPEVAHGFYHRHGGRVVYKCLSTPVVDYGDGRRSMIYTSAVESDDFAAVVHAPSLFQENVGKDHELRVAVVGDQTIAVRIDSQQTPAGRQDWRKNMPDPGMYSPAELPEAVAERLLSLNRALRLRWSMIDLIVTKGGEYVFLEANPDGAWGWLEGHIPELQISEAVAELIAGSDEET